jgi:hypothetical protein
MMNERPIPAGERRRADPEIILPSRDDRQTGAGTAPIRVFVDGDGSRHIYVARLGPLGNLLLALMIGILFAIMLVLALGAFLIAIPLVGLLVAAVIISGIITCIFSATASARRIDSASRPRRSHASQGHGAPARRR